MDDRQRDRKMAQATMAELLQEMLLAEYKRRIDEGILSDTGLAALQRLLMSNGWNLDPSQIPQGLMEKLTTTDLKFDDSEFDDDPIF